MRFPLLPSAVQTGLTPASDIRAPSVNTVVSALALKASLAVFTTTTPGLVPASVTADATKYLDSTGAFSTPAGTGGGGGGVTAHSALTGLGNDDHTQYLTNGRGDIRYAAIGHVGAGGTAHANVVSSGAAGFMTGGDKAKLDGIAASATANSSDAVLLSRSNHTGQQDSTTISDFAEAVDDRVSLLLVAGANVTLNYNDAGNALTISSATVGGSTLADGSYGDVSSSSTGSVITVNPGVITLAKMANLATDRLIGRDTAGTGVPESLAVTGGIEFTGTGGIQTGAFTGDVTKSAGGTALSIAAAAVTLAKMANLGTDQLIGRDTAGTGVPETIGVTGGIEFSGAGSIQTSAFTGDVTKTAGGTALTLASGVVSLSKMANLAQDQFIGRVTASSGVPETATITAAARTVLDDASVGAMLNTLGGGTATGTGVVVLANTPTLITPVIGAATGTSLALGGGTALATTNRTGTGNLVLATDPTITRLVMSGIYTSDGAQVNTVNAMAALAIDVTKGVNTKTIVVDSTFTFSGTPATAQTWFGLFVTNGDTNPHILTLPSAYDMGAQATLTTTPIPAGGKLWLLWRYDGSTYHLMGTAGYLSNYGATTAPGVGDDVADGYGPGSLWLNATSNISYICESNAAGAAVWNAMGGGVSDADYGDITVASGVWTIDNGVVTLAKQANIATDSLIGRDTASTGVPEVIGVTGGIEFNGTGSIRTSAFTGDVTKTAGGTALTIANSAVTLAKMADVATATFIGRVTAGTGVPESLTATQATSLLNAFTTSLKGLVPASGGGTTNFLRADGTFAAPAGGGTVTNTGGNLTANSVVLGAGTTDTKVVAGLVSDGVSKLTLGVAGASVGGLLMANATSGTVELRPVTGALGTGVISVPAATDTMALLAAAQTLTNKTLTAPVISTITNTGTVTLFTASDTVVGRATTDTLTNKTISAASNTLTVTQGKHLIPITAGGMAPSVTGGCAALASVASAANQPDIVTLDFDTTTQEFAQFAIPMPKSWNEGTVTFQAVWSHAATTTNFGVAWSLAGLAVSDNEAIAQAYGTAVVVTDTGGTTNNVYTSAESAAITIAGSPANDDTVFFRVARVPADAADTMAIDARLHGIRLYFTTSAETDA